MMHTLNNYKSIIVVPLLLVSAIIVFATTQFFQSNQSELSSALTLDLVITIPLVYYIQIRKKPIPKFSVFTIFLLCIFIASIIIPKNHQQLLDIIKYIILPVSEIVLVIAVFIHTLRFSNQFKTTKSADKNFYDRINLACKETFPNKFGEILATEMGMLYFFLIRNKKITYKTNEFTYFKKNGTTELIGALILIIIAETFVAHILLEMWSPFIANLCSLSSVYLVILLISILKSTKSNPISINEEDEKIDLRYGFFNQSSINISDILTIEKTRKSTNQELMKLSPFNEFDGHNIIIHFKQQQTMKKMYGITKDFDSIGIYVDEPDTFIKTVQTILE